LGNWVNEIAYSCICLVTTF